MRVNPNFSEQKVLSVIPKKRPKGIDKKTYEYLKKRKQELIKKKKDYTSLQLYDLKQMESIHKGIKVFKNFKIRDFLLFEKLESILLQSGCKTQCRHCGAESSPNVITMKWEHFLEFTNGLKELTKRLGFCPINKKNQIGLFRGSDPMHLKMRDDNKKEHGINQAAKKFFYATSTDEHDGIKTMITTAGWNKKDKFLQKAANKIVENPEYIEKFIVSISPFDGWMYKSIVLRERSTKLMKESTKLMEESESHLKTDPEKSALLMSESKQLMSESKQLKESANNIEKAYIEKISNALKISIKLPKSMKNSINLLYHPGNHPSSKGFEYKDTQALFDKIKENLLKEGIDLNEHFPLSNIDYRDIRPVGRALDMFHPEDVEKYEESLRYYSKYFQKDMIQILTDGRIVYNDEIMQGSFRENYKNPNGKKLQLNVE